MSNDITNTGRGSLPAVIERKAIPMHSGNFMSREEFKAGHAGVL